jgi:hypothetical protein
MEIIPTPAIRIRMAEKENSVYKVFGSAVGGRNIGCRRRTIEKGQLVKTIHHGTRVNP